MSTCNEEFEKWFAGRYPRENEFTPLREFQAFKDDAREIWAAGWSTRFGKVHHGFFNRISDRPMYDSNAKYTEVYDICNSSNGALVAFATSKERADAIVEALNSGLEMAP